MAKRKGSLQKLSIIISVVSFALAVVTGVALYFKLKSVGSDDPVSASLMASIFFFICVGVILTVIGRADIPSFKFDDPEDKE